MKDKLQKYLLPNLPYLFFVYLFDKLCEAVRLAPVLLRVTAWALPLSAVCSSLRLWVSS